MTRQHIDRPRHPVAPRPLPRPAASDAEGGGSGLRRFLGLDRAAGAHPAPRLLHARRPAAGAEGRLGPFLRLLRGRPS